MAERNPSDDRAAFGVFPQLQRNRSRQDREAAKNVPVDLARGFVAGVAGAPGDIESLIRLPYDYFRAPTMSELVTGEKTSKTYLPTSEDIEKRLPLRSETPVSKAATGLGTLAGGFYTGPGSPLRVIGALPGAVRHGAEEFAKATYAGAPNVVKREGGNWIQNTIDNSIRGLKQGVIDENAARRLMGDDFVNERMGDPATNAINKWIESKIGRYVKNEMGTPSDPIRLLIEKREAEIADKFMKDQARANRMADRAAEEVDPRRKANLTRQAQRMLDDAVAQRDLAMEHTSHLPRGFQNVDANEFSDDVLKSVRKAEGFPEQGMGTTPSSRAWESKADMSIYPINVGEIQSYPANKLSRQKAIEEYNAYEDKLDQDVIKYLKSKGIEGQYMAGLMKMSGEEKAALVGDTKLKELLDAIPPYSTREPIYEAAGKESYIGKLDPKSSVYSGDISGLHFDHIVDVLKQDVASGRITPEQLNKITMEQAVRRTADYDLERSVAMREAKIKQQEGFPVHKEYPDEGYKWIELTKPKITVDTPLPEGFRWLEPKGGYERLEGPSLLDPQRTRTYLGDTKEQALKVAEERSMLGSEQLKMLEDALKYEGDTMGHCVGGYCPDVAEGRSRIYSLRDSKGEPHVTIEVQPQNEKGYYNSLGSTERADLLNKAIEYRRQTVPDWDEMKNPVERAEMLRDYLQAQNIEIPARIVQIKGKQNLRPIEKYDPYTQDFVKSGNWSDIGDLKNTGLFTPQQIIGETSQKVLAQEGIELPKLMTKAEADDYIRQAYKAAIKQNTNIPPPEGMKRGGRVRLSNNRDTMMLELNNKKMADGGYVGNYNTAPDMNDGGAIIQGAPFNKGGEVSKEALTGDDLIVEERPL